VTPLQLRGEVAQLGIAQRVWLAEERVAVARERGAQVRALRPLGAARAVHRVVDELHKMEAIEGDRQASARPLR
jgi:hypothetical protein